jgi:Leucine-rich repeat (LRR) protein
MQRIAFLSVCLLLAGLVGCQPAAGPTVQGTPAGRQPPATSLAEPSPLPTSEPAWPVYTEEQTAAARQMAADLGIAINEDAEGNVASVNTAANRSWVDNFQMEEILAFPRLRSLTVEGPSIDDALAPKIAEQAGLELLAVPGTLIGDEGIAQLAGLKFLKAIDLRLCSLITDKTLETLSSMPELRAVRISGTNVTDAGVASLLVLPQLAELDLRNCRGVTVATIEKLADKKTLRMLKIGGEKIDDGVLAVVGKLDMLTGLSLDNCPITDAGVAKLAGLPLDELTIYQCANVTDEGLGVLSGMDRLARLTLRDVGVRGTALRRLPKPEKLVSLNLGQSRTSDADIENLAALVNLETLVLSETAVTDAAAGALSKLSKLKRLTVTQTGISGDGVKKLQAALPKCHVEFN